MLIKYILAKTSNSDISFQTVKAQGMVVRKGLGLREGRWMMSRENGKQVRSVHRQAERGGWGLGSVSRVKLAGTLKGNLVEDWQWEKSFKLQGSLLGHFLQYCMY